MRATPPSLLETGRIREGEYGSTPDYGMMGAFALRGPKGTKLLVMASTGLVRDEGYGWEHVSVSKRQTPTWNEMCFVKDLFWSEDETVIQYHPPRLTRINLHPHCLHMWRPIGVILPAPPSILVGPS